MRVDSSVRFGMTVERVEDALDKVGVFSAIAPALRYLLHPCSRMQAMILTCPPQASQVSSGTGMYRMRTRGLGQALAGRRVFILRGERL